jgi:hypothetical protein
MNYAGAILKMRTEYGIPVRYFLKVGENEIFMNELLGKQINIKYLGYINCIRCGKKTNKSFAQGYCYPCFLKAPETEDCVLRPELCQAHLGIARDIEYAKDHCLIDHFVYLSYTSNVKVGVTRHTQIPTRWIDQGATSAIKIAKTNNRYIAGLIEVALKENFADKTNWRNMIINKQINTELTNEKLKVYNYLPQALKSYFLEESEITLLEYPSISIPEKITSINLDKDPLIDDILVGIKGQYLVFETGKVINIRNFAGYNLEFSV